MQKSRFPYRPLLVVLLIALVARLLLLASDAVSFHADEAIVGLMARHILGGARPTFFYGQAYMGSLDAWLIAFGFRIMGESVLTIPIVQSALYLLTVAAGYVLAWRLSERVTVALTAGLILAIPPVNTALYTTATLGGYNETLLFGTLILLLSYEVTHDFPTSYWRWALLGLCAGLGWWTNGLIVVYALPAALLIVYAGIRAIRNRTSRPQLLPLPMQWAWGVGIILALLAFVIGSAPWWIFDFTHDHAALATYISSRQSGEFAGIGLPYVPPLQRAAGLLFIGLPALIGLRFPWSSEYFLLPLGIIVVFIILIAIFRLIRGHNPLKPDARGLVLGMLGLFCIIFVASSFGADPTGRYFLPLLLPLGIVLGALIASLQDTHSIANEIKRFPQYYGFAALAIVLIYHAAGQLTAASSELGLTTQFDLVSHIDNGHDADLIAFLDEHDLYNGYTNYWVAFRFAFLTGERMQYNAALPYKTSLDYNPADNRYPPYVTETASAERVAVITTNAPELDDLLTAHFTTENLTYQETFIGAFHIFYDFAPSQPRPPLY